MSDHDKDLDTKPVEISLEPTPPVIDISDSPEFEEMPVEIDDGSYVDLGLGSEEVLTSSEISQSQEKTRAKIALTFTQIFLFLVVTSVIMPGTIYVVRPELLPEPVEVTKELVTMIASVLAGPFGFIVGFYFKKDSA